MKKLMGLLFAALLFLTACGNEETAPVEEPAEETAASGEPEGEEPAEDGTSEDSPTPQEVAEDTPHDPSYRLNPETWTLEPIADAPAQAVLLTIDDAPDEHAIEMAETLQELDVPAVFFVSGQLLEADEKKEELEQLTEMGFAIGNHTQTHPNLSKLTREEQQAEIQEVNETVTLITGEKPLFFRAPHGVNTDVSNEVASQEGTLVMNWTYGYDWHEEYQSSDALTDIMVNSEYLTDGAILLMHDRAWTAEALPGIIEGLREKGYTFVDPLTIEGTQPS